MTNTSIIQIDPFKDKIYGSLVPIEENITVPFSIQRIYYIYDVPVGQRRGFHSHKDLEQALICVHGSVMIHTRTPFESEEILLNDPTKALCIGPMVWREMYDFSSDAVLLVLASKHYDTEDYIRDYVKYEILAREYFTK